MDVAWAGATIKDGVVVGGKRVLPTDLDNDESNYDTRLIWKRFPKRNSKFH